MSSKSDADNIYEYTTENGNKGAREDYKQYTLCIDIGSYRTNVVCWPEGKDIDSLTNFKKYRVEWRRDKGLSPVYGDEFPSGFLIAKQELINAIDDKANKGNNTGTVLSIKKNFVEEYRSEDSTRESSSNFKSYIRVLLTNIFETITNSDGGPDNYWDNRFIPQIKEIKVTIPDLFIENLRQGFLKSILSVCQELKAKGKHKSLLDNCPNDSEDSNFVSISTDENGAGEIYFNQLIKTWSHIHFNNEKLKKEDINLIKHLFMSTEKNESQKSFDIIYARIDIGGLTTDASLSSINISQGEQNDSNQTNSIKFTLKSKQSFSSTFAGEKYLNLYHNFLKDKSEAISDKWYDDEDFLTDTVDGKIAGLCLKMYNLFKLLNEKKGNQTSIYFIVSGRPTKSALLSDLIEKIILSTFNKENLSLMKEHCFFFSKFPYIWREDESLHVEIDETFSKSITVLGNVCASIVTLDEQAVDCNSRNFQIARDYEHTSPHDDWKTIPEKGHKLLLKDINGNEQLKQKHLNLAFRENFFGEHKKISEEQSENLSSFRFLQLFTDITKENSDIYENLSFSVGNEPATWMLPSIEVSGLETLNNEKNNLYNFGWVEKKDDQL